MKNIEDIRMENHGSIWLVSGTTPAGKDWLAENVAFEQFMGNAGAVEPRYVGDIAQGAQDAGLLVQIG